MLVNVGEKVMLVMFKDWKTLLRRLALVTVACTTVTVAGQGQRTINEDSAAANISKGIQIVRSEVHHDVSLPLRDLIQARQRVIVPPGEVNEAEPVRSIPLPRGLKPENELDQALQSTAFQAPAQFAPTAGLAFDGLGNSSLGFFVRAAP